MRYYHDPESLPPESQLPLSLPPESHEPESEPPELQSLELESPDPQLELDQSDDDELESDELHQLPEELLEPEPPPEGADMTAEQKNSVPMMNMNAPERSHQR